MQPRHATQVNASAETRKKKLDGKGKRYLIVWHLRFNYIHLLAMVDLCSIFMSKTTLGNSQKNFSYTKNHRSSYIYI